MRPKSLAVPTLAVAMGLLCTSIAPTPARALPPATGSKCDSSWVNNAGAMACFIKGEDESHAGVKHPHYVACVGGDIFCCVDNDAGHQNCEAQAQAGHANPADWQRAILSAHKTMTMQLGRYSGRRGPPHSEIPKSPVTR